MTWSWFSFLIGAPLWGSIAVLLYGSASAVKAIRNRADEADEVVAPYGERPTPVRTRPRPAAVPGATFEPYLPQITGRQEAAHFVR